MVGKGMLYKVLRQSRKVLCDQIFVLIKIIIIMVSFTAAVTNEFLCENANEEINAPMLMFLLIYLCHSGDTKSNKVITHIYLYIQYTDADSKTLLVQRTHKSKPQLSITSMSVFAK